MRAWNKINIICLFAAALSLAACATIPGWDANGPAVASVTPTSTMTRIPDRLFGMDKSPTPLEGTIPNPPESTALIGHGAPYPYPEPPTSTPYPTVKPYPYPYPPPPPSPTFGPPSLTPAPTVPPVETVIDYPELGITWQECNISNGGWPLLEECLGRKIPEWTETDMKRRGIQPGGVGPIRQVIGNDVYETRYNETKPNEGEYLLLKNNDVVFTLKGMFTGYDPNQSLMNIGGIITWEFADLDAPTIVYDGRDLRQAYGLEAAYRPYDVAGKLLFVARKEGKYFVMYAGQQLGPTFDKIFIAYCCETAGSSIRSVGGEYWFLGNRDGQNYGVVVTAIQ